jgi:hypothetical protein
VELPNSFEIVVINLDEIRSTSSVDSTVLCSFVAEVNPFDVIFDLNGILITTCFDKGFQIVILRLGLKEFLEKCLT